MIRGRTRPLPVKASIVPVTIPPEVLTLNADFKAAIHNRFDIEVVDSATGEIKQRAQAENVVCNALWTRLLAPTTYNNYIHYGTGSGTPSAADTSLFTFLGYGTPATADDVYNYDWANGWASLRRKIQLSETAAVGATLTEVGIGYATTAATLCTHAMLKDMNGNTITIAKTNTDVINIYATVFVHWGISGYDSGSINIINNTNSAFITYLLKGATAPGLSNAVFSPGGRFPLYGVATGNVFTSACTLAYSAANKTITATVARIPVASGNLGGLGSLSLYGGTTNGYDMSVTANVGGSWYSGAAINGETIGTGDGSTKDFATDFGFVQSGAKIYVDGVEQTSGVTIDTGVPIDATNMGRRFVWLPEYSALISSGTRRVVGPVHSVNSTDASASTSEEMVYYNPYYSYGIKSFASSNVNVYVSDDLETWVNISGSNTDIPAAYRYYKYWKAAPSGVSSTNITYVWSAIKAYAITANNIHFTTPPPTGAVITADYTTKTIAKDANHVFDLSVTIQLGEKTT